MLRPALFSRKKTVVAVISWHGRRRASRSWPLRDVGVHYVSFGGGRATAVVAADAAL